MTQSSWQRLRDTAPSFAICLLFASSELRSFLSDSFRMIFECEAAQTRASDPMLTIMRLTALQDMIASGRIPEGHDVLKAITCYKQHPERYDFLALGIPDLWIRMLQNDMSEPDLWAELITHLAGASGQTEQSISAQIGRNICLSRSGKPVNSVITARQIRQAFARSGDWLIALNGVSARAQTHDINADPLLVFRLFWLVLCAPDRAY